MAAGSEAMSFLGRTNTHGQLWRKMESMRMQKSKGTAKPHHQSEVWTMGKVRQRMFAQVNIGNYMPGRRIWAVCPSCMAVLNWKIMINSTMGWGKLHNNQTHIPLRERLRDGVSHMQKGINTTAGRKKGLRPRPDRVLLKCALAYKEDPFATGYHLRCRVVWPPNGTLDRTVLTPSPTSSFRIRRSFVYLPGNSSHKLIIRSASVCEKCLPIRGGCAKGLALQSVWSFYWQLSLLWLWSGGILSA